MGDTVKNDEKTRAYLIDELTELRLQNDALKKTITGTISAELAAEESRRYAESIVETVREPLLVLDADLKIISANRNFYRTFKVTPGETIGSFIYDLGNKQWDIPKLRELLEEVLPEKQAFDDFEVDHDFQEIGHKIMLLNACRIYRKDISANMIRRAIEDITERKRLEDLLTESEERYRRLFETASDGIVLLEKGEGKITHANPATEKMLGYTQKDIIGNKLQDIGVLLDMGDFQTTMQTLNKIGILNYDDVPVETKSGKHIDTEIYLVDRARLVQCNIRDITDRKQTEVALRESEERYRVLFEGSIHGIVAVDLETGRFSYANPSIYRMFGYSETEFLLLGLEDIHPADSLDHVKTAFELQRRGEKALVSGLRCLRKDGTVFYADITAAATIIINGRECLVGFFGDITERKEIEAGLEKTRKELAVIKIAADEISEFAENVINTVREPLIALDEDLRVVKVSRSFYDFFKVSPEETVGQLIYDLGNKQWDIPKLRELLETILPEKASFDNYEVEHDFVTIGRRTMLLNARQIERASGKERIILLAIEDITERKQVEEKIRVLNVELQDRLQELTEVKALGEKANRGKTEFLANISHELTTPLNHIIGFSQILLTKNFGDLNEKQRGYMENILNSGERLHDTLKNIISFVSMDVSNPDMDWEDLRLKDIITSSLSVFQEVATDRHLTITLDMAEEADRTIRVDRGKLGQVFHNLLSNSVKFSREGGQITIIVRYRKGSGESGKDGFMEVTVEDTGIGIKEEDLPRLFQPFQQLEVPLTKQFAGVGMGLVLARKLIEAHGGASRVESNYGKGSKFIFTIPVKDRHEK